MKNKIVLITGAHGFLGRNVARYFKNKGWTVLGLGFGKWTKDEANKWGIDKWIESGVTLESISKFNKVPEVVVHAAGKGSVGYSILHPKEDLEANVSSVLPVLEYIRLYCPNTRLIYPSSAAVYGNLGDLPIKENAPLKPISPYGINKIKAEKLLKSYSSNYGGKISIIRFFSIYGPDLKKQLFWDACEKINNSTSTAVFFGTGKETRDWLNIKDACSLIYETSSSSERFEIINGGTGKRNIIKKALRILVGEYGKSIKIIFSGNIKKGDPKYYYADISKALKKGWKPTIDLKEGISEYVRFYKSNL
jgi:UDP-glucose 4-epimerase